MIVWRKSTTSMSGDCVEVARDGDMTLVRDSKDPRGPVLAFTAAEWAAFLAGVKAGEFDLPAATGR
jgi:predicted secreted Zn-dependent protease